MRSLRQVILCGVLALVSGACTLGIDLPRPPVDPAVTCAVWTTLADDEHLALGDRLTDSAELLERVRQAQQQPVGTSREVLIRDVVGSVSKGCDVWAPPGQPISEVFADIYAR